MTIALPPKPSILAPELPAEATRGAKHICLDIETGFADRDAVKAAQALWTPPPAMKDEDKIEAKRKDAFAKIERESALLDAAPLTSVAFCTESENAVFVISNGRPKGLDKIKGLSAKVYALKDERTMLVAIREWLDARAMATTMLIGFNIIRFDLPKLRNAYLRHRLRLPMLFAPEARDSGVEVYDVMMKFVRFFSAERSDAFYISLDEVTQRLGMPRHKHIVSGEDMPRFFKEGKVKEIVTYCFLDTADTYSAFLTMTGQFRENEAA